MFLRRKKQNPVEANVETETWEQTDTAAAIECAGRTDIGKRRLVNQDQFLIADMQKSLHVQQSSQPRMDKPLFGETMGKLFFLADGMGGAQAGEVASQMAIQSMAQYLLNSMHWLFHPQQPEIEQFIEDLKTGALQSHQTVRDTADGDPNFRGMGTTLTVAYVMWPMLYVLHVGDSRCYILRNGQLQLLTKDQTLAQHLFDCGQLKGAEFSESPYHHVLLSAIGAEGDPNALVYKTRMLPGDRIMLCSDGVNAHLEDAEIETILSEGASSDAICQTLIETANERGGHDNITAIVGIAS
ncbi:MAG: serine/threonine protein phosphatase PrpC [Mariniblastus sp.]|jgi:serine/threonine protein phosphatase PrpC